MPMARAINVRSPASGLRLIRTFAAHRTGPCRFVGSCLSNSCPNLLPYPCRDEAIPVRAVNNFSFGHCFGLLAKFGNETVGRSTYFLRSQRHVTGSPTGIWPWPINWVGSCGLKCDICPFWAAWGPNRDAFPCGHQPQGLLLRGWGRRLAYRERKSPRRNDQRSSLRTLSAVAVSRSMFSSTRSMTS